MRAKLVHSQKVLEGLTLEDFNLIAKHAQELSLLSQAAQWQVLQTPDYLHQSREFRRVADRLTESARQKNLDGATLAFTELTTECVHCHKYVRRTTRGRRRQTAGPLCAGGRALNVYAFAKGVSQAMRAMVLDRPGQPLQLRERELPQPALRQLQIRVEACGVCRTDLHVVNGELPQTRLPIVPGHEIVGTVTALGSGTRRFAIGQRVGVPWLGHTCGVCEYCRRGEENLCDHPGFTGCTIDGGYADFTVADEDYCFPIPQEFDSVAAAPLLFAGLIGYRSLRFGRIGPAAGDLWLWRRGPYRYANSAAPGAAGFRLHPSGRLRGPRIARDMAHLGRASTCARPRNSTRPFCSLRPAGLILRSAGRGAQGGGRGLWRHSHDADPQFQLRPAVGRTVCGAWPISRDATATTSWPWPPRSRSTPRRRPFP